MIWNSLYTFLYFLDLFVICSSLSIKTKDWYFFWVSIGQFILFLQWYNFFFISMYIFAIYIHKAWFFKINFCKLKNIIHSLFLSILLLSMYWGICSVKMILHVMYTKHRYCNALCDEFKVMNDLIFIEIYNI